MTRYLWLSLAGGLLILSVTLLISARANADPISVLVLTPAVSEPYRSLFANIYDGIKANPNIRAAVVPIDVEAINDEPIDPLVSYNKIVVLDPRLLPLAQKINATARVYVGTGAGELSGASYAGVTSYVHPRNTIETLRKIAPDINVTHHIYNPAFEHPATDRLLNSSITRNHRIVSVPVSSAREAALVLNSIFSSINPEHEAIWLSYGVLRDAEDSLLTYVLEESWKKQVVVFSSEANYVRRGLLFSLLPDFVGIGDQIARMIVLDATQHNVAALDMTSLPAPRPIEIELTETSKLVFNRRAASHLGIKLTKAIGESVAISYPQK